MFRTEVVHSKNLRKKPIYKIYNLVAIIVFLLVILVMISPWSDDSSIAQWIDHNYVKYIQPGILGIALLIFVFSSYMRSQVKNPRRLGSLEMGENEIKYLENDELVETIPVSDIRSIAFEYYSFRMRGNPMGCMNYLQLSLKNGHMQEYEIVVANSMTKAELASTLLEFNKKVPVKVGYSMPIRRLMKDSDFRELS